MAYINQETKKALEPKIKSILNRYGVKGSIRIKDYAVLIVTLRSGKLPFYGSGIKVWERNFVSGKCRDMVKELYDAMNEGNYDESRPEIDYFSVGWYSYIHVGEYDKPYVITK